MYPRQRCVINHIGSKNNLILTRHVTRRQRTFDLTKRNRIHLHALFAHQTQNMNIRARLLGKTHYIKLAQFGNLRADDLRIINPYRTAEFGWQTQQVVGGQVGISVVEWAWHSRLRYSFFYDYATARRQ